MEKIKLEVKGLSYSQSQTGAYALILSEVDGNRKLPIIIGSFEAQSIALELEKMHPTRPLTHDLFKDFALMFGIYISEVIIHKFQEGVFYSKIIATNGEVVKEIDSRTSDAVALALRFNCPIFTYESILKETGISFDEEKETKAKKKTEAESNEFSNYNDDELQELLQTAVENEEYEKASQIRDEINKRKSK